MTDNASACLAAARVEGIDEAIESGDLERVRDIWRRRLSNVPAAPACDECGSTGLYHTVICSKYHLLRAEAAPVAAGSDVYGAVWSALIEAGADVGSARKAAEKAAERARTAHPEPAAAEPVAWKSIATRLAFEARDAVTQTRRSDGLVSALFDFDRASASAPSQPSEGPARVTDAMVEVACAAHCKYDYADNEWPKDFDDDFGWHLRKQTKLALEAAAEEGKARVTDADLVVGLQLALCQPDIDAEDLDTARKHAALIAERRTAAEGK